MVKSWQAVTDASGWMPDLSRENPNVACQTILQESPWLVEPIRGDGAVKKGTGEIFRSAKNFTCPLFLP